MPGIDFAVWQGIVEQLRGTAPALASLLDHAVPMKLDASAAVLGFAPSSFEATRIAEPKYTEPLTRAIHGALGPEARVSIELTEVAHESLTLARVRAAELWARREAARQRVLAHPLVRAAIEELGAELRDVRVNEEEVKR